MGNIKSVANKLTKKAANSAKKIYNTSPKSIVNANKKIGSNIINNIKDKSLADHGQKVKESIKKAANTTPGELIDNAKNKIDETLGNIEKNKDKINGNHPSGLNDKQTRNAILGSYGVTVGATIFNNIKEDKEETDYKPYI